MANALFLISGAIAILALFIAAIRFFRGPTVVDRVIAFDALTIISISLIAIIAYTAGRVIYLDVAIVYGLLSFLGVLVVARYYERGL
jgi:multicomponent Na+:H+ antiporter subunit F